MGDFVNSITAREKDVLLYYGISYPLCIVYLVSINVNQIPNAQGHNKLDK